MNATITKHRRQWIGRSLLCVPTVLGAVMLLVVARAGFADKVKYTYDGVGRLVAAEYGPNALSTFLYDANGNLLNRTTAPATNADVRLFKTSDVTGRSVGFNINYTLTVSNAGPTAATGVTVTDPVPFGILLTSASASQGSVDIANRTVTADVGVLPAGSSATVTIVMFHAITNRATNIAIVTTTSADPALANNIAERVTTGLGPINDSDGDGMPNWWESLNGLGGSTRFGADGDPDGDGVRNFDEWLADTNPRDPNSFFAVGDVVYAAGLGQFSVSFLSSPIRRYVLEFTEDLSQPFTLVESVDGTGAVVTFTHISGGGSGFYRVQVVMP